MPSQRRTSPAALLTATALIGLTCGAFVVSAPAANAATGAYSGNAAADLVHVNALNVPDTFDLLDAYLAPVTSVANTASSPRVTSHATNASLNLLGSGNQNLLVDALQTAPPDHATGVHDELLNIPAAPLLTATVAEADAHSRWTGDGSCVTTGNISHSISKVADAVVLPGSPAGFDAVALTGATNEDPSGAVVSETSLGLVKQPAGAANYAVRSTGSTQITGINLFGGQLVIEVVRAPKVVATATGVPGTSTVTLTQPILKVNGTTYLAGEDIAPINIPGLPVIEVKAGILTKTISADGTSASGSGTLLSVKALSDPSLGTALDLTVGDVSATAKAPAGGVNCSTEDPLRDVRKDTSATSVNAGQSFDYTITVPNRGSSDMTNVTVKDTVSGSPALVLVSSTPDPTSHSGNTYNFSLGTIAPNQVKTISMTFKVPASAEVGTHYSNTAVITATYAGQTITKTVTTPYPVVDGPGAGPCDLSQSTKYASHLQVTPGENFNYYINLFNQGGQTCTGIVIKDVLDDGVSFVSCSDSCTHSGQTVTWNVASLAPSDSKKLIVTVKTVATSGSLPNSADITPDSGTGGTPSTPGPTVSTSSVLAPDEPAERGTGAFAATGASPLVALLGTVLLAGALVMRRRALTA
jgi:uncharacterized repeat protein (TIGR01451 family)